MEQTISAKTVEILVHSLGYHTLLKDAKTGKYIDANAKHIKIYGFDKPQDIIGHDIWGLNDVMSKMWEDNAKQVSDFDAQVIYTCNPVIQPKRVWLNAKGFVWVHHMSKLPVIGENNTTIAILSLGNDLTKSLSLLELYKHYKHFYKSPRHAIAKFLEHVGVINLFHEMPNNNEVMVLIERAKNHQNKIVANNLNFQLSTIHSYINQINSKVTNLDTVISILKQW